MRIRNTFHFMHVITTNNGVTIHMHLPTYAMVFYFFLTPLKHICLYALKAPTMGKYVF